MSIYVEEYINNSSVDNYVFFIHGFTGSSKDWDEIIPTLNKNFNIIAIDLPGHGKSDSPEDTSFYNADSLSEQLHEVVKHYTDSKIIIIGYSMGGRAALTFAVKHPSIVKGLILESSNAGITNEKLRIERIEEDEKLARFIETNSIKEFTDYWMNIPLFDTQKKLPPEKLETIRNAKLKNSKTGLANSLRGFGAGIMPPLTERIKDINCTTVLITGELDKKYTLINKELAGYLQDAEHKIIANAGHNVHLEQPELYVNVINAFLNKFLV